MPTTPSTTSLTSLDMLSQLKAKTALKGKQPETGFKDLFDDALAMAEKSGQAEQPEEKAPVETKPDDAVLSNAAAAAATTEAAPDPGPASEGKAKPTSAGTGADATAAPVAEAPKASPNAAAAQATAARSTQTGEILSMRMTGTAATGTTEKPPVPEAPLSGQIVTAPQENETGKLGAMLGEAQQKLQQRSEATAATDADVPLATTKPAFGAITMHPTQPAEPAAPAEPDVPAATTKPADNAKPVGTPPAAETAPNAPAAPSVPVAEAEVPAAETPATEELPAEAAGEASAPKKPEAPKTPEAPVPQPREEAKPTVQRVYDKLPEADRAVMDMREPAAARQRVEPVKAEETQAAAGFQQTVQTRQAQTPQAAAPQQAQQPPQAEAPNQAEQIQTQIAKNLESGRTEFRMQLAPEELGKISVRLVMESGRLAVEIVTAGAKTAELLNRQAEALGSALRAHTGMELTSMNIVSEASNASGNMNSPFGMGANAENGAFQQGAQHGRGTHPDRQRQDPGLADIPEEEAAPEALLNTSV